VEGLWLKRNHITPAGASELAAVLKNNPSVTTLDLVKLFLSFFLHIHVTHSFIFFLSIMSFQLFFVSLHSFHLHYFILILVFSLVVISLHHSFHLRSFYHTSLPDPSFFLFITLSLFVHIASVYLLSRHHSFHLLFFLLHFVTSSFILSSSHYPFICSLVFFLSLHHIIHSFISVGFFLSLDQFIHSLVNDINMILFRCRMIWAMKERRYLQIRSATMPICSICT
jgi:hypothetical protein